MDFREALLINRYCSSLNSVLRFRPIGLTLRAAPALAARGHPRLTQAGSWRPTHCCGLFWTALVFDLAYNIQWTWRAISTARSDQRMASFACGHRISNGEDRVINSSRAPIATWALRNSLGATRSASTLCAI